MTLMSREYCSNCDYPLATCLCSAITVLPTNTRVTLMTHPSELKNAKNTGRLLRLSMPSTNIIKGEDAADFADLQKEIMGCDNTVILYPSAESRSLRKLAAETKVEHIVVIDATWKKAHKIWMSNPWLHGMKVGHLDTERPSQYRIRKSNKPEGVASIEAVAAALEEIEDVDTSPLWTLFDAMQSHWPAH